MRGVNLLETIKQKDAFQRLYEFLCSDGHVMKVVLEEWKHIIIVTKCPLTTVDGTEIWQVEYDEVHGTKIGNPIDMSLAGCWFPEEKKFLSTQYRMFDITNFADDEPWIEDLDLALDSIYKRISEEIYKRLMEKYPTLESLEEAGIFPAYDYEKSWSDALWQIVHNTKQKLGDHVSWRIKRTVPQIELLAMHVNDDAKRRERLEDDLLNDKETLDQHLNSIRKKYDFERTREILRTQPPNEDVKCSLEIHDAIMRGHYEGAKTFRVFCKEDGTEVAYIAEADRLRHMQICLSDDDFKTPRPRWMIYAKDILRITYGRAIVYEKGSF